MRVSPLFTLILGVGLVLPGPAAAQGLFGDRNIGSSFTPGQRTFGGGGGGGAGGGGQSVGAEAGQLTGNERFLRENRQPGTFVGNDAAAAQQAFSNSSMAGNTGTSLNRSGFNPAGMATGGFQGRTGAPGFGGGRTGVNANAFGPAGLNNIGGFGAGRNVGGFQQGGFQQGLGNQRPAAPVPIRYRVGFDVGPVTARTVATEAARRLQTPRSVARLGEIDVQGLDQTVVLRGVVATQQDRALAEQLIRLEPGVGAVRNELRVAAPGSGPAAEQLPEPPMAPLPPDDAVPMSDLPPQPGPEFRELD